VKDPQEDPFRELNNAARREGDFQMVQYKLPVALSTTAACITSEEISSWNPA
jgi:hypothetical protein